MPFISHITVASVIEKDGKYLMVKEIANGFEVYNQPAGHWEIDETLEYAAIRETFEETAWDFTPDSIIGIYRWKHPEKDEVYLRVTFSGKATHHYPDQALDDGIIEAVWMSHKEIAALPEIERRSAMVLKSIEDYENGRHCDLSILSDVIESW